MSSLLDQRQETRERQSLLMMSMEKKLNPTSHALYKYLNRTDKRLCKISTA